MAKTIKINDLEYELVREYKDGFNEDKLREKHTEYFDDFDYIFGDYSYERLRLKGFNDEDNENKSKINSILYIDEYIKNYCSFECRYFLLKKVKKSK